MSLILPFRPNKLAFPGGLPGINPAHPAAQNLYLSAVAVIGNSSTTNLIPGGFTNLTNGAPCTVIALGSSAGSLFSIDGGIGPAQTFNASANSRFGINLSLTSGQSAVKTVANIFRFSVQGGAGVYQGLLTFNNAAEGLYILNGIPEYFAVADNASGITLTVGHAYFVAACARQVGANISITYVVKNLTTGLVQSATVTKTSATLVTVTKVTVANDAVPEPSLVPVAAGMYSGAPLSLHQLLQWADDPWSFWYPQQMDLGSMLKTSSTGFTAAFRRTLSSVGTRVGTRQSHGWGG